MMSNGCCHDGFAALQIANETNRPCTMIKKKSQLLKKRAGCDSGPAAAEDEDEAPSPKAKPGAKAKVSPGTKVEAVANEELVALFESYDEAVSKAESYFVELVEYIQDHQVDRATVVASMMRARGINYETAQSQYSRMKKIYNNEEVLQELKDGKINLKIARERTKDKQKNPKSSKPAAKEARYTNTLKAFVAAAKESGFALKEIMLGVEAELRSAKIK